MDQNETGPDAGTSPAPSPAPPSSPGQTRGQGQGQGQGQGTDPGDALLGAWQAFDIERRRAALDKLAGELADTRDRSRGARKALVRATSDFRKMPADDAAAKAAAATGLVKMYQDEIDAVIRRCKAAEGAFAEAYRTALDVPDGAVLAGAAALRDATAAASSRAALAAENRALRAELASVSAELAALRGQEGARRRAEAQLREAQAAAEAAQHTAEREAAARAAAERDLAQARAALDERAAAAEQLQGEAARALRASQDGQGALLAVRAACEQQVAALRGELDLARAELAKRATAARALAAERDQLAAALKQFHSNGGESTSEGTTTANSTSDATTTTTTEEAGSELKVAQLELELERVRTELGEERGAAEREREEAKSRISELEERLARAEHEREEAQRAVPEPEEHARLVRELETLRMLVGEPAAGNSGATTGSAEGAGRRLQAEAAELRAQLSTAARDTAQLRRDLTAATDDNARLHTLVRQLEEQLAQQHATGAGTGAPSGSGTKTAADLLHSAASSASAALSRSTGGGAAQGDSQGDSNNSSSSTAAVLEIVCAQRDRSRARIVELEAEKAKLMEAASARETEAQLLRADNLRLYERIRFLEAYPEGASADSTAVDVAQLRNTRTAVRADEDVEARYDELYEPGAGQKGHVLRRHRLGAVERAVLRTFNVLTRSRAARYAFAVYAVGVHLLLLVALVRSPSCPSALVEAAQALPPAPEPPAPAPAPDQ